VTGAFVGFRLPLEPSSRVASLTPTEREVAIALTRGWSTASVASQRAVSPATVANQIASVFGKLSVSSRAELAAVLSGVALGSGIRAVAPRSTSAASSAKSVLLLEDDARVADVLATALGDAGYRVVSVDTLSAARRAAATERPDVALCDIALKGESAITLLEGPEPWPYPTILLSGSAHLDQAIFGLSLGAWDFVDKGAGIERIRVAVGEALQGARATRSIPGTAAGATPIDARRLATGLIGGEFRFVGALEHDGARHVLFEHANLTPLTAREILAVARTISNVSTKAVASELAVSEVTAWTVIQRSLERLGFAYRMEAITCLAPLRSEWVEACS